MAKTQKILKIIAFIFLTLTVLSIIAVIVTPIILKKILNLIIVIKQYLPRIIQIFGLNFPEKLNQKKLILLNY